MAFLTTFPQLLLLLLPVGLSAAAVIWDCLPLLPISVLLLCILLLTLPLCRGDELPWAILLSAPMGLPGNLLLVRHLASIFWTEAPHWLLFLRTGLALYILFSVETLFLCLLLALLRPKA